MKERMNVLGSSVSEVFGWIFESSARTIPVAGTPDAGETGAVAGVIAGVPAVEGLTGCWVHPLLTIQITRIRAIMSNRFIILLVWDLP